MKYSRNPLTGRNCSGYRFQFKLPSLDHRTLYLPLDMKDHPYIRQLMQGISPLSVFAVENRCEARAAFRRFRKRYDFDYWAFKEFFITDVNHPDSIVPLRLNDAQFHVVDILRKRYFEKMKSRYVISKSIHRCGLTTCIQAYILWMQTEHCRNNSYVCGPSEICLMPLKKNLCRYLHRDIVPSNMGIFIRKADGRAFFNTFRSPDAIRGINLGYVHYVNMSLWRDPDDRYTSRSYLASLSAVLLDYRTLVVLEGDIPRKKSFCIEKYLLNHPRETGSLRKKKFARSFSNPFFINEVMVSMSHKDPYYFHIHLSYSILQSSC